MKHKHGNAGKRNAAKGPESRSAQIAFRVEPAVRAKAEKRAKALGLSLSDYLHSLVIKAQ